MTGEPALPRSPTPRMLAPHGLSMRNQWLFASRLALAAGVVSAFLVPGCGVVLGLDEYSQDTCKDGLQNGDESGIDCGGACSSCSTDSGCSDGARNNGETDIDCGGPCVVKCDVGKGCAVGADCISLACGPGSCIPAACDDQVKNGDETGMDCGGSCPLPCKAGVGCQVSDDCESQVCDAASCVPNHVWSLALRGPSKAGISVDGQGNLVLSGVFDQAVDFGGGPLMSAGGSDVFVAKLDSSGKFLWGKGFGSANEQTGVTAVDSGGNIILAGTFVGSLDFEDGPPLTSVGAKDVFIAKLDPSGKHLWSKRFGDLKNQEGRGVAVDGAGNVVVTGVCVGTMSFGGMDLTCPNEDVFLVKLDPNGGHIWSKRLGDSGDNPQEGNGVAVDPAGNIAVTGGFVGVLDLGAGKTLDSIGYEDIFVAKFTEGGALLWGEPFGQKFGNARGLQIAADATGGQIISGSFNNTIDLGGGPIDSNGLTDWFLMKLDDSGGHVWSRGYGTDMPDIFPFMFGSHADGSVTLASSFQGTVDLGGGPLPAPPGTYDIVVGRLGPSGDHRWSRRYAASSGAAVWGLAPTSPDSAILSGAFGDTLNFGGMILTAHPETSTYLVKLLFP